MSTTWRVRGLLAAWFGLVAAHYLWTVEPAPPSFHHYRRLTDAFLAGRVSLELQPPPELLALPDPYEPVEGRQLNCHDCSLFDGKYYLYFGVAPLLTLFLPFRLVTGVHLAEKHAAAAFFLGATLVQSLLLLFLADRLCPRAGRFTRALLLLFLAFSGFQPFLLRRAAVYEVPIAAGVFFVSAAVLCFMTEALSERVAPGRLALGSLSLGLAVASRPHHVLAAPLLSLLLCAQLARRLPSRVHAVRLATAVVLPLALCCLGIAAYNQHRYGRFWEFGQSYVLDNYNHTKERYFSLEYVPSHLLVSLIAPPSVDLDFPFVHMYPAWLPSLPHPSNVFEATSGALACVPALALAFASPALLAWSFRDPRQRALSAWAAGLLLAGLVVATFVASFRVGSARYLPDFCSYLALSTAVVAIQLDHRLRSEGSRWLAPARLALGALVLYGTLVSLAVGLTGMSNQFRNVRPAEYARLEDAFFGLQRALLRWGGGHGGLRLVVRVPEGATPQAETLIRLASPEGEDALCVRRRGDGRLVFAYHRAGQPQIRSEAIPVSGAPTHVVELSTGSLYPHLQQRVLARHFPSARGEDPRQAVRVRFDGSLVLEGAFAFEPGSARLAAGPAGACPAPYSGEVLRSEQEIP